MQSTQHIVSTHRTEKGFSHRSVMPADPQTRLKFDWNRGGDLGRVRSLTRSLVGLLRRLTETFAKPQSETVELRVLHRVALDSRHALLLISAQGMQLLVATSTGGSAAFFPIDRSNRVSNDSETKISQALAVKQRGRSAAANRSQSSGARISW